MKKILLLIAGACLIQAQNPMSKETKDMYTAVKGYILKSAEKMPEANYSFKASPDVRSYGAILGHLIDDQYFFCAAAKGEAKESNAEKTITTKAGLVEGLKAAFAYCDSSYDSLTDAKSGQMMKFGRGERSLNGILNFNIAHDFEHYGNLITYLRIKGLVPPSSEKQ
ncbi:MAG TPA: DinB family protein [Bryobacteraceae bacterium]|nr:DinB family protein [Bryobacteraceae bacterium]